MLPDSLPDPCKDLDPAQTVRVLPRHLAGPGPMDWRFFIATGDFPNRRTLGKLDKIISALEGTAEDQIVVGGQVEDVNAAS